MEITTPERLELIRNEDLDTLIFFDDNGLLIGPDETIAQYVERLEALSSNFKQLNQELQENGSVELFDTRLEKGDAIPLSIFESVQITTRTLYDFSIDWVPGFFTNSRMGFLFAGCAMYSYEDFFAVFIVRKSFKSKEKWIIYSRTELIAHELCHIAHIAYRTKNYEEIFAYKTAESSFRSLFGGMLHSSTDTHLLLASVVFLLLAQIINIVIRSPLEWQTFPMPQIFVIALFPFLFILVRHLYYWNRFRNAYENLVHYFGSKWSLPVLFRCSEDEIKEIAKLRNLDDLRTALMAKQNGSIRWKIIMKKYSH